MADDAASAAPSASLGAGASRQTSAVVALLVGTGLALAATLGGGVPGIGATAAAGVALGVAVLCRARDGPEWAAAAAALTPLAALGGVAGVGLVAVERGLFGGTGGTPLRTVTSTLGFALGAGMATLGATGTLGDGLGDGAVRGVWRSAVATTGTVGAAFAAVLVARFDPLASLPTPGIDPGAILRPLMAPTHPTVALVSFPILVVAAALAGRSALSALPITELVSRRQRESVAESVDRLDAALTATVTYGVLATGVSLLSVLPSVRAAPPVRMLALVLASPALRGAVLALGAVAAGLALAGRLLRAVAGGTASTLGRRLPATAGGAGVVAAAVVGGGAVRSLSAAVPLPRPVRALVADLVTSLSPAGFVLGATLFALVGLTAVLTVLGLGLATGLVPARGSAGALAGAGLVLCGAVAGVVGASGVGVFVLVGLGVVAWDASAQGVAARADLGPRSATRIEAVHAVGSVGVAAVGVAVAWAAYGLVTRVALADGVLVGAVVAVAGSVLLLGVLRG
ncbi:MAG: hypothetical protein ABEI80_06500 [Haloplanus sp.]